jgi:hypothetical protein
VAIPALVEQLARGKLPDGQPAQDEGTRAKTQSLAPVIPVEPDQFDAFDLSHPAFGNEKLGRGPFEDRTGRFEGRISADSCLLYTTGKWIVQRSPRIGPEPGSEPGMGERFLG